MEWTLAIIIIIIAIIIFAWKLRPILAASESFFAPSAYARDSATRFENRMRYNMYQ
jgi:hypothetical protein